MSVLSDRLRNQLLAGADRRRPAEVVSWLGAMQAQDFPAAKWAVGLRAPGCHDAAIEQAFNDGHILRTHVLRPTWHFVAPADIRWMLALSAPRVHAANAYYYRQASLDARTFAKSCAMMQRVLDGGKAMTRAELALVLGRAKIPADGLKLAYLIAHAELDGVICSGPRRGKQFTYMLLDDRAPAARPLDRRDAAGELAKRYFRSHGPATLRDFRWWSGLTAADARQGIEAAALETVTVDGLACWRTPGRAGTLKKPGGAFLLPNYDEYLIAYKDRGPVVDAARAANIVARANSAFAHHVVIDGRLAGSWMRTLRPNAVQIDVAAFKPLTPAQTRAVRASAECYAEFLGLPATVKIV